MREDLLTKNPMDEDLLTKIQREMDERLRELRGAVDEHDRLQGDLSALQDVPAPPVVREPPVDAEPPADPGLPVDPEPLLASEPPAAPNVAPESPVAPEPLANVVRLPARHPPRIRMVSPKVARLMRVPRRPALERAGVVRVGAGRVGSSAAELVDEIDVEGELFERSL
jgi:hypothetical protein